LKTEGRYDRVLKILEGRAGRITSKIDREFKKTKPFDKQPVSSADMIMDYMSYSDEVKEQLRQSVPQWNTYEQDILKRMEGMRNA
jgi:hypothetical protein